jgi:phage N-6-adenine-methyltransferase
MDRMGVHYSRKTTVHATPRDFFAALHAEFGFTLDVCATPENATVPRYFTPETDGLAHSWAGEVCWMNPPYGREIGAWMRKAAAESGSATVVCLIPARTDTAWWHETVWDEARHRPRRGVEVRFVRGRLRFGEATASAPFPNAVVVFRPAHESHSPAPDV